LEKESVLRKMAELQPHLKAEGVEHLAVFGSRSREDSKSESDIDILIEVDSNRKFSVLDLVGVEHVIQDATGLVANALMRRSLKASLKATAEREAIEVF